jgi:hypothetical protein
MDRVQNLLMKADGLTTALRRKSLSVPVFIDSDILKAQYHEWLNDAQMRMKNEMRTGQKQPREKTWMDYFVVCLM